MGCNGRPWIRWDYVFHPPLPWQTNYWIRLDFGLVDAGQRTLLFSYDHCVFQCSMTKDVGLLAWSRVRFVDIPFSARVEQSLFVPLKQCQPMILIWRGDYTYRQMLLE